MSKLKWCVTITAMASIFLWLSQSEAAISFALSLEELTAKADVIAQCKVISIHSDWNKDKSMIFTYVELLPSTYFKKDLQTDRPELTLKLIGGIVGDIETVVVGGPKFRQDEETILYMKEGRGEAFAGFLQIVGLSQGKFDIQMDPVSAEQVVVRNLVGMQLIGSKKKLLKLPMPLADFLQAIKTELK